MVGVVAALALGCGRFGFDPRPTRDGGGDDSGDGGGSDGPPADAAALDASCQHAPVSGTAIYVSPAGLDSNPGTSTSPVATVTRAHMLASANTTIVVRAGNYTAEPNNEIDIDKTNIRLISEPIYAARVPRISCLNCNGLSVEGFEITGSTASCMQVSFGINVTIRNNIIHGCAQAAVRLAGDVRGTLVDSNVIYDSINALVHINNDSIADIRNNVIFDAGNGGDFPMIWLEGVFGSNVTGNIVFNGRRDTVQYGTVAVGAVTSVLIENNLFGPHDPAFPLDGAIGLDDASGDATIRFNTFRGPISGVAFGTSRKAGLIGTATFNITHNIFASPANTIQPFSNSSAASPDGFVLDRNLYWNPPTGAFTEGATALGPGDDANRIVMDPRFVSTNPSTAPVWLPVMMQFADGSTTPCDLRGALIARHLVLPPTSPAAGASMISPPAFDIRGRARPTPATLGAYEP